MKKFNLFMTAAFLIAALFTPSLLLASGKTLKVAIIAPSASNDLAFTQSIVDGIKAIQKDRKIDLAITDGTFIVEDAAAAIRDYAKKGYDLVLAHGLDHGTNALQLRHQIGNGGHQHDQGNDDAHAIAIAFAIGRAHGHPLAGPAENKGLSMHEIPEIAQGNQVHGQYK